MESLKLDAKDAAKMLGVTKETIYNYIKNGVLDGEKRGGKVFVKKASVEQFARLDTDTLMRQQIAVDAMVERLEDDKAYYSECLQRKAHQKALIRSQLAEQDYMMKLIRRRNLFATFLNTLLKVYDEETDDKRTVEICSRVIMDCQSLDDVADDYGLSRERIRCLLEKGVQRMSNVTKYTQLRHRNIYLEEENKRMQRLIADLKQQLAKGFEKSKVTGVATLFGLKQQVINDMLIDSVLGRKMTNLDVSTSVRMLNGMRAIGVETLYDLVQKKEDDIVSTRDVGRKTLVKCCDVLARYGLKLGMTTDEIYAYMIAESKVNNQTV